MTRPRNSVKARRECFDKHKRTDALGRIVMDCHICNGVILPGIDRWEAEHVIMHVVGGEEIKPAHYSPCHKLKTKSDVKKWSKAKRVRDRRFGITRPKGFYKPEGAWFDWGSGRYRKPEEAEK